MKGLAQKAFEDYLKQKEEQEKVINWELKKEEWTKEIDTFLEQIKCYFKKYKDSGVVIYEQPLNINEEYIGSYSTKKLIVKFNNDTVIFTPVGRNIIGAKGRVDMEGKAGKVKFVLVGENSQSPQIITTTITNEQEQKEYDEKMRKMDEIAKQEKNAWKISTPPPKIKYLELTEDSFFNALMEVING